MNRAAVGAIGIAAALAMLSPALAQTGSRDRFDPVPTEGKFTPSFVPWGANLERLETVMLVLKDQPVALAQAVSPSRKLTGAEKQQIATTVARAQEAVESEVRARGGNVLGRYQHALNGLKVRLARRELPALRALPNVAEVRPVTLYAPDSATAGAVAPDNAVNVPSIGATTAWDTGFTGERIKVAIIDSGIDYTHANFGGPGRPEDYTAAKAAEAQPANPAWFGPNAPKVKGGIDLVGDAYDGGSSDPALQIPHPDANPLDCGGHGSHVAGTVGGFGVLSTGARYTGPYSSAAMKSTSWRIGPGVAPKADLYSVRVFGCHGTTDLVVDAIEWAVKNDMDVINMSLGSPFGVAKDATALAAENAAKAGLLVVASAGNSGHGLYLVGAPSSGSRVLSVAALDGVMSFPGAQVALTPSGSIQALNANLGALPTGALAIHVLRNPDGSVSLGCNEAEYAAAPVAGKLVVTQRGVCDRTARAIFGQKYGAAAVALINNGPGYPPFEGEITGVSLPFLGILPTDGALLTASTQATLTSTQVANPTGYQFASFSSSGPRLGDDALKPSITAPGVSVKSTLVGSGSQGTGMSGTSMAAPHVTGVAALVKQAHPRAETAELLAAMLSTASPDTIPDYEARLGGYGAIRADAAVRTSVVASADKDGSLALSFGFAELARDHRAQGEIELESIGKQPATFRVTASPSGGSPHTVEVSPALVTVRPGSSAKITVRLNVPAQSAGDATFFREVAGFVTFTPTCTISNGGIPLRVPYYFVPRARSQVKASLDTPLRRGAPSVTATLRNARSAPMPGSAQLFALGPQGRADGKGWIDLRAVGVRASDAAGGDRNVVFAVSTFEPFSTTSTGEFDISIDSNFDGKAEYTVFGIDEGKLGGGKANGKLISAIRDHSTGVTTPGFYAVAPPHGTTVIIPVLASQIGLSPQNPRFTYSVQSFSYEENQTDSIDTPGLFNAFGSTIGESQPLSIAPGSSAKVTISINSEEWGRTPPAGLMIVNLDDHFGPDQAELFLSAP